MMREKQLLGWLSLLLAGSCLAGIQVTAEEVNNQPIEAAVQQEDPSIQTAIQFYIQLGQGEPIPQSSVSFDLIQRDPVTYEALNIWQHRPEAPLESPLALAEGTYTLRLYDSNGFVREDQALVPLAVYSGNVSDNLNTLTQANVMADAGSMVELADVGQAYELTFQVQANDPMLPADMSLHIVLGTPDATVTLGEESAEDDQTGEPTDSSQSSEATDPAEGSYSTQVGETDELADTTFTVKFADSFGQGLAGVQANLAGQTGESDASGAIVFEDVAEGTWPFEITALPEGYTYPGPLQSELLVTADSREATLTLEEAGGLAEEGASLTVQVVDENQEPVADVHIGVGDQEQVSDASGQAIFTGLAPGLTPIMVVGEVPAGYLKPEQAQMVELQTGVDYAEVLTLVEEAPSQPQAIRVIDQAGEPVADARILVGEQEYTSDASGLITVEASAIGSGINYQLNSLPEGYSGQAAGVLTVNESGAPLDIQVQKEIDKGSFTLTIVDQAQEPVEGADVALGDKQLTTDAMGQVVFADLEPGRYTYTLQNLPEDYQGDVTSQEVQIAEGASESRSLTVERVKKLQDNQLSFVDQFEEPLTLDSVQIDQQAVTISAGGKVLFNQAEMGEHTYAISYKAPDNVLYEASGSFQVEEGQTEYIISVERPVELGQAELLIQDQHGQPVKGVQLAFGGLSGTSDAEGRIAFTDLELGYYNYDITELPEGYEARDQAGQAEITEGTSFTESLTVEKLKETGQLHIEVKDDQGRLIPGAKVQVNGQTLETNEAGQVEFKDLPVGNVTLTIIEVPTGYQITKQEQVVNIQVNETVQQQVTVQTVVESSGASQESQETSSTDASTSDESATSSEQASESGSRTISVDQVTGQEARSDEHSQAREATEQFRDPETGIEVWVNPIDAKNIAGIEVKVLETLEQMPEQFKGEDNDYYQITLKDANNQDVALSRIAEVKIPTRPVNKQIRVSRVANGNVSNFTFSIHNQRLTLRTQALGTFAVTYGEQALAKGSASQESASVSVSMGSHVESTKKGLPGTGERRSNVLFLLSVSLVLIGAILALNIRGRRNSR